MSASSLVSRRFLFRSYSLLLPLCLGIFTTAVVPPLSAQEASKTSKPGDLPEEVASVFMKHGLRIVGTGLALESESEVTKEIKDLAKYKKSLMLADRERYAAEAEVETVKQRISDLR